MRKVLSTIDYPGDGKVSILMTLEAPEGTVIARHTHPGIESSVVTEGELELEVQGQPASASPPARASRCRPACRMAAR